MSTTSLVIAYLIVLVIANLIVFNFGQLALVLTSVLLIPFDFAVRVRLQELWQGSGLWIRLLGLMLLGGILTILTVPASRYIATASVTAFFLSSLLGAVAYEAAKSYPVRRLRPRSYSLGVMALVDSVVFPLLAFEEVSAALVVTQFLLKWLISDAIIYSEILESKSWGALWHDQKSNS